NSGDSSKFYTISAFGDPMSASSSRRTLMKRFSAVLATGGALSSSEILDAQKTTPKTAAPPPNEDCNCILAADGTPLLGRAARTRTDLSAGRFTGASDII